MGIVGNCVDCGTNLYDHNGLQRRCHTCQPAYSKKVAAQTLYEVENIEFKIKVQKARLVGLVKKHLTLKVIGIWIIFWLMFGCVMTAIERTKGQTGCVYSSLASITNIPYLLGCELFRDRFQLGK